MKHIDEVSYEWPSLFGFECFSDYDYLVFDLDSFGYPLTMMLNDSLNFKKDNNLITIHSDNSTLILTKNDIKSQDKSKIFVKISI